MTPVQEYLLSLIGGLTLAPFDAGDILAYCEVESSFNPFAYRFEPALNEASYGIMQILASSAKDRGLSGQPSRLFEPYIGVTFGVRQLQWEYSYLSQHLGRAPTKSECALAYNEGVGNLLKGTADKAYLDKWSKARAGYSL